jgi:methyl-accepting chemotaxis protein
MFTRRTRRHQQRPERNQVDGKTRIVTFTRSKAIVGELVHRSVRGQGQSLLTLSEFRASAVIATVIAVVIIIALGMLIRMLISRCTS